MCVWLSLFQLAWNSRSRSDSRRYAWRGGLVLVCEQGTLTFCGCTDCLSMFVFVCTRDEGALLTCCIYRAVINVFDMRMWRKSSSIITCWRWNCLCPCQLSSINTRLQYGPQLLCLKLCFPRKCLLIQNRLNQTGTTLNLCVFLCALFVEYLHAKRF